MMDWAESLAAVVNAAARMSQDGAEVTVLVRNDARKELAHRALARLKAPSVRVTVDPSLESDESKLVVTF